VSVLEEDDVDAASQRPIKLWILPETERDATAGLIVQKCEQHFLYIPSVIQILFQTTMLNQKTFHRGWRWNTTETVAGRDSEKLILTTRLCTVSWKWLFSFETDYCSRLCTTLYYYFCFRCAVKYIYTYTHVSLIPSFTSCIICLCVKKAARIYLCQYTFNSTEKQKRI